MNNKPWFQNPRETPAGIAPNAQRPQGAPAQPTPGAGHGGSPSAAAQALPIASAHPAAPQSANVPADAAPSQLIVGPKIRLNGAEIEQCDSLVIEGHVKATVKSRSLRISSTGTLEGDADIELAEIEGSFTGTLNAGTRLIVKSAGRVTGTIRYGKLVVEDGGELGGDVRPIGEGTVARPNAPARKEPGRESTVRDGLLSSPQPA